MRCPLIYFLAGRRWAGWRWSSNRYKRKAAARLGPGPNLWYAIPKFCIIRSTRWVPGATKSLPENGKLISWVHYAFGKSVESSITQPWIVRFCLNMVGWCNTSFLYKAENTYSSFTCCHRHQVKYRLVREHKDVHNVLKSMYDLINYCCRY